MKILNFKSGNQIWLAWVLTTLNILLSCPVEADQSVQTYPDSVTNGPDAENFILGANGKYIWNTNPARYWRGTWKEDTNGWRVRLNVPTNTADLTRVDVGSVVKNSGPGYFHTPNGKFAKFELLDSNGRIVPQKLGAGTNLLKALGLGVVFSTNLPAWAKPVDGILAQQFPQIISIGMYPRDRVGDVAGYIYMIMNSEPSLINQLSLKDWYVITNEGDYTLTVCPVLYKEHSDTNEDILDRLDLPCVTAKVHLIPGQTPTKPKYRW